MSNIPNRDAYTANRQGRLTPMQAMGLVPMILIGGVFFVLAAFISVSIIYALITHTFKGSVLAGVIFGGGLSLVFLWLWYVISGTQLIDIVMGRVRQVEGKAMKYSGRSSSGKGIIHYYSVGDQDFQIMWSGTWKALPDLVKIRAYYTPYSKSLVNYESLFV
jgi:hypothetical protein